MKIPRFIFALLAIFALSSASWADDVQGVFYNPTTQQFQGQTRANGMVGFKQGSTNGASPCQGCVGEVITWAVAPADQSFATIGTTADWTNATITVSPGTWMVQANINVQVVTGSGASNSAAMLISITDSSNTVVSNMKKQMSLQTPVAVSISNQTSTTFTFFVQVSTPTTYKIRGVINGNTGATATLFNVSNGIFSEFFAVRR